MFVQQAGSVQNVDMPRSVDMPQAQVQVAQPQGMTPTSTSSVPMTVMARQKPILAASPQIVMMPPSQIAIQPPSLAGASTTATPNQLQVVPQQRALRAQQGLQLQQYIQVLPPMQMPAQLCQFQSHQQLQPRQMVLSGDPRYHPGIQTRAEHLMRP